MTSSILPMPSRNAQLQNRCNSFTPGIASEHQPAEALRLWLLRYADFIGTKRGLATALHSGDPAFDALPDYFDARLRRALRTLLDTAVATGQIRADVDPDDLLRSVAGLSLGSEEDEGARARRMVALLVDGLRYGASNR